MRTAYDNSITILSDLVTDVVGMPPPVHLLPVIVMQAERKECGGREQEDMTRGNESIEQRARGREQRA
jgi:hypothetical protein